MNPPTSASPGPTYRYQTTDLRGSTVVVSEISDRIGILMLRQGAAEYLCKLFPVESLGTFLDVSPLQVQPPGMKPYAVGDVMLDTSSTYFYAAGWLPANATSIEFSVKGTVVHRVTHAVDGSWSGVWKVAGSPKLVALTYTTRSASGAVLATGPLN